MKLNSKKLNLIKLNSTLRTTLFVICLIIIVLNFGLMKNTYDMTKRPWSKNIYKSFLYKIAAIGIISYLSFGGLVFLLIFTKDKDEHEN